MRSTSPGNFERIKKPNWGAKYLIDVIFDAPDAHIRLNRNCE